MLARSTCSTTLSGMDMVDNMFDQLPEEKTHDDMDTDDNMANVKTEVKEEEEMSDLRKLFYEREVSQGFSVSVMNVKPGFKKTILEVEPSDGIETSTNYICIFANSVSRILALSSHSVRCPLSVVRAQA